MTSLFVASLIAYTLAALSAALGFIALFGGGQNVLTPFAIGVGCSLIFLITALVIQGIDAHLRNITERLEAIRKATRPPKV